ncbi:unnamed protein product, partial [marine sediment metagenome]
ELIDDLKGSKTFLTPLVFIPIEEALLSKAKRVGLSGLTELQWEFITQCWRQNIDFWAPEKKPQIHALIFSVFWAISRWKHGKKSVRPVMKLAGFPENFIGGAYISKSDGTFDPHYEIPLAEDVIATEIDKQSAVAASKSAE